MEKKSPSSSWEEASDWYERAVGTKGHYYHQKIILPGVLRLLDLKSDSSYSLLDLACGQGVLSRHLPKNVSYLGVDASKSLIHFAKQHSKNKAHRFLQSDISIKQTFAKQSFTHATLILALQNVEFPLSVFENAYDHLENEGIFILVMNHPCFRIPRQSCWQIDEKKKLLFRRIDRYFSPLKIPIQTHPSLKEKSSQTWSFHYPLSTYSKWLKDAGFQIELIEEWCSDKVSTGKAALMENRSRKEFPLFLTIVTRKMKNLMKRPHVS